MTAKGRRVLSACDDAVGEMEEEMMRELNPTERATLLEALKSCVRSLHGGFPALAGRVRLRRTPPAHPKGVSRDSRGAP